MEPRFELSGSAEKMSTIQENNTQKTQIFHFVVSICSYMFVFSSLSSDIMKPDQQLVFGEKDEHVKN